MFAYIERGGVVEENTEVGRRLPAPTLPEIQQWPASVDVPTAASAFGISRSHAYELVARGEFPAKVIRVGNRYRVITATIVRALSDDVA